MIPLSKLKNDPVRIGVYLVAGVFLIGAMEALIFALTGHAGVLEGAFAVLAILAFSFAIQAVVAFSGCALVWKKGRTWSQWTPLDYVGPVVPWCFWALLTLLLPSDKSFVNIVFEGALIGFVAPLGALLKLALARSVPASWSTGLSLGFGALLAFGLWRFVPLIRE